MRSLSRYLLLTVVVAITASGVAFGSGFALFEQGAKATAMACAFAATADDPSAMFYNVAGIAQQRRMTLLAGGTAINFNNQFTGDPNDPFTSGTTGKYKRHTFIPPNAYAILPVGENLTLGVGVMTPFGLRTNWEDPWPGRFVSKDANIKVVSVQPSIAWQTAGGKVAIGAGAEYRRGRVILARNAAQFNPFSGRISDVASSYLSADWSDSWGWTAGILLKPNAAWRIGASYRAPVTIDFTGTATTTQIPTGIPAFDAAVAAGLPRTQGVETALDFPENLAVGVAFTAIPDWTIEADVTRTGWSAFKELSVTFLEQPAFSFSRPQNWNDTYSYRLGTNHAATPEWDVRLGALYDQNPQDTEVVSPLLPDADRIGASFGVGWHQGPWIVDASAFLLHFKTRSTDGRSEPATNFNGTYKTNANLFSLNLGYRF